MEQQDQTKQPFFYIVPMANLVNGVIFDKRLLITSFERVVEAIGKYDPLFAADLQESKGYTLFLDPLGHRETDPTGEAQPGYMHPRPHINNLNYQSFGMVQVSFFGIAPHGSGKVLVIPACTAGQYGANQQTPMLFDMVIRNMAGQPDATFNRGFVNE
ncbi:hypothetical protein [Streptomyces sp. CHB9.2]|uniref:hypothetical protein n=1 Tax=Streptomyces sp. CHB9.2 TaxID=2841670 RepID=UPI0020963C92|nr:hypothetical protein [Streptomyces sp. CHB9.2]MCO6704709.1 hypothetical protein [Streptomyces sp. CHB9.2]